MPRRAFEAWVDAIFDHPVTDPEWYWDIDADTGEEDDETEARHLTRLFTQCDTVLRRFDDDQVGQGFWFLASNACSHHASAITGGGAPWPVRRAAVAAIYDVYAKCFAQRCRPALGHLGGSSSRLNLICYMWWDVFPAWVEPDDAPRLHEADAYLAVMERCLSLDHPACLEGALHGLGHWALNFPDRVAPIIDRFLRRRRPRPELARYARAAREGAVP